MDDDRQHLLQIKKGSNLFWFYFTGMLTPQDIRIGNYILWNPHRVSNTTLPASRVEVTAVLQDKIGYIDPGVEHRVEPFEDDRLEREAPQRPYEEFEPIPLTMDLLETVHAPQLEKLKQFMSTLNDGAGGWWFGTEATKKRIEFLHQLQNLYFDFIGEELQLSEA